MLKIMNKILSIRKKEEEKGEEITFDDFTYKGNSSSVSYAISTSNDEVIAISGHTLNAVGEGSCKITVSFSNGDSA